MTRENAKLMTYETSSSHGDVCRDPLDENSFFCPTGCARHGSVPYCKAVGHAAGVLHPCRVRKELVGAWKRNAGSVGSRASPSARPLHVSAADQKPALRGGLDGAGAKKRKPPDRYPPVTEVVTAPVSLPVEERANPSADIDIFIRCTKAEAYRLLPYALESIRRYGLLEGLIRSVVLCFPSSDAAAFAKVAGMFPGLWLVLAPSDAGARGLSGFFDDVRADSWAKAPFVMHMEASSVLCEGVRRSDLISSEVTPAAPFLVHAPFGDFPKAVEAGARPPMEALAPPGSVKHYTVLGRSVFPRMAYDMMRRRLVKQAGGGDLEAAVRRLPVHLSGPLPSSQQPAGPKALSASSAFAHTMSAFGALLLYVAPVDTVHAVPRGALLRATYDFVDFYGAAAFDPTRSELHGCFARCVLEEPSTAERRCGLAAALARHRPPDVPCVGATAGPRGGLGLYPGAAASFTLSLGPGLRAALEAASGARADERRTLGFRLFHEEKAEKLLRDALDKARTAAEDEKAAAERVARWGLR